MNRFWQFIIKTRNFCHQTSIKQYGIEGAGSEYKFNLFAFVLGYVITIIFIVLQAVLYFYVDPIVPLNNTDPWYVKLLAGGILFVFPAHLITRFLLKKIEHIPLPTAYNPEEYRRFIWVFWVVFLLGWVLWITIGIFLMSQVRGIEIQ